ncbi:hypothetical protein ACWPKS_15605 [Coraliomargarita sp. W4R72]
MYPDKKNPTSPSKQSLHSASGFGKPTRSPFPEQNKQTGDDAMKALLDSIQGLSQATEHNG